MKITSRMRNFLLVGGIMLLAGFFRLYQLDSIPPGLYPDVAINGTNALQSLQSGDYRLFYPDNNGREGLIMWMVAGTFYLFGISIWALKFPAAVIGTLTVLGVYLLTKQLFERKPESVALLAALFTATSFWHINFSRVGFRAIMVPFFIVFSFYFLWKAFKSHKVLPAIFSGISFGLGFYTYISFRLAVPLLFLVLALWLVSLWKDKKTFVKVAATMLLATFFTALPIGLYFLQNPADFFGRAAQTSILSSPNPVVAGGISLLLHLGMFNIHGDQNWRHNYPPSPELFCLVGILFLIGIMFVLRGSAGKTITQERLAYITLILWFGFLLLPGVLTNEGIPHALRVIGIIPAVMIISAIGGVMLYDWLKNKLPLNILKGITAIFIIAVVIQGYWQYFIAWAKDPNTQGAFTTNLVRIGEMTSRFHNEGWQTAVIVNEGGVPVPYPDGVPMPAQTTMFAETADCYRKGGIISKSYCGIYSSYLKPDQLDQIVPSRKTIFVPLKNEQTIFDKLNLLYPQGQIKQENNIIYYEIKQ